MSDKHDNLDKLTSQLLASPALLKAWHTSSEIEYSYAWYLLNHSWKLSPEVPAEFIPHNPRFRLWDSADGWTDNGPCTLTVFLGPYGRARCRHAVWHCKQPGKLKQRLIDLIEQDGQVQFYPPGITFTDADIPLSQLQQHLEAIATYNVPAIHLQSDEQPSITSDAGSAGFEFFSKSSPPAKVRYTWSVNTPLEWKPLIREIERLRDFLRSCF